MPGYAGVGSKVAVKAVKEAVEAGVERSLKEAGEKFTKTKLASLSKKFGDDGLKKLDDVARTTG